MAVKIDYDSNKKPINPTLVLSKKNGEKIGAIPAYQINLNAELNSGYELSFKVSKYIDGTRNAISLWNEIKDFRLVYCPEWNLWFELDIDISESSETVKTAVCKSLGEAELSQIMIFDTHFNDEVFISSNDYEMIAKNHGGNGKLVLHDPDDLDRSMVYRLLKDKAPHYHIGNIDSSLITITQKSLKEFVFDNKSLYDCLWEIAKELEAIVIIDSCTVTDDQSRLGEISRTINMYDTQSYCYDCGYRGNYSGACPRCNSSNIFVPDKLGKDTTIFISTKNLSNNIDYKTDNDSVKNCFRLEAGDDLMTTTIINCNPNGSQYLWYINDETKEDMSSGLVSLLNAYNTKYNRYQNSEVFNIDMLANPKRNSSSEGKNDLVDDGVLILKIGNRNYYKTHRGLAYIFNWTFTGSNNTVYRAPVLVSKNSSAVTYKTSGDYSSTTNYEASFNYNGDTWYAAGTAAAMPKSTDYSSVFADFAQSNMESYSGTVEEALIAVSKLFLDSINYKKIIVRYNDYLPEEQRFPIPSETCVGYSSLMEAYYNSLNLESFIRSEMMPTVELSNIIKNVSCQEAAQQITSNINGISLYARLYNDAQLSELSITSIVLNEIKLKVSSNYKIEAKDVAFVRSGTTNSGTWSGKIVVSSYYKYDDGNVDSATTEMVTVYIGENNVKYYQNYIETKLRNKDVDDYGVAALFRITNLTTFKNEINKYGLNPLKAFADGAEAAIAAMQELQVSNVDNITFCTEIANMLTDYANKLNIIESILTQRELDLEVITGSWKSNVSDSEKTNIPIRYKDKTNVSCLGIQMYIDDLRADVKDELNIKTSLGQYYSEFCSFRREDTYKNDNYISTALNDAELFNNARDFINVAQRELYKSATLQHSISANLYNLLVLDEFREIINNFELGNWLRLEADGEICKLRLISYEIDYENLNDLNVNFSDVFKIDEGYVDLQSLMSNVKSISTSYNNTSRQANSGNKASKIVDTWFRDSMSLNHIRIANDSQNQNQQWDDSGMYFRRSISEIDNTVQDDFDKEQLKILNNAIVFTDDSWSTIKTAIGKVNYINPTTGVVNTGYGIIAENIIGKFILGENLSIVNTSNTFTVNKNGVTATNGVNTITINPNNNASLFSITKTSGGTTSNIFSVNSNGDGTFSGTIYAENGDIAGWSINATQLSSTKTFGGGEKCYIFMNNNPYTSGEAVPYNPMFGLQYNDDWKFYVRSNGELYAKDAEITGNVTATSGQIGGWTIDSSIIYQYKTLPDNNTFYTFMSASPYDGNQGNPYNPIFGIQYGGDWKFFVRSNGELFAKNASITGTINGGTIIGDTYIYTNDEIRSKKAIRAWDDSVVITHNDDNTTAEPRYEVRQNEGTTSYGKGIGRLGNSLNPWRKAYIDDGVDTSSDKKIKDHIEYLSEDNQIENFIMQLKPVMYKYKDIACKRTHLGLYAQDVSAAAQSTIGDVAIYHASVVGQDGQESYYDPTVPDEQLRWYMTYEELIAPTIAVLQKAINRISVLESEIQELKENVNEK